MTERVFGMTNGGQIHHDFIGRQHIRVPKGHDTRIVMTLLAHFRK